MVVSSFLTRTNPSLRFGEKKKKEPGGADGMMFFWDGKNSLQCFSTVVIKIIMIDRLCWMRLV
jgi:hypothetical protein